MSDNSAIEWTDATWNPIRVRHRATGKTGWHCEHVSPGCEHCYAETVNHRFGTALPFKPGHRADLEFFLDEETLLQPLRWKKPRRIFVCSMTDLFAPFVEDAWIDQLFAVMALCPQHQFQVLTKRPERMRAYFEKLAEDDPVLGGIGRLHVESAPIIGDQVSEEAWEELMGVEMPLPNVWLGVSVEDQQRAHERLPYLMATPAAVRFASVEPLLGPVDLNPWLFIVTHEDDAKLEAATGEMTEADALPYHDPATTDPEDIAQPRLDWVIVGGESGRQARPMHPDWARALRDQCADAEVPFFFKQWGEWAPEPDWYADHHTSLPMRRRDGGRWTDVGGTDDEWLVRVGKKAAGRLLDGREHNGMPGPA